MIKKRLSMLMVLLLVLTSISFPEKSYAAGVSKLLIGRYIRSVYINDVQVFSSTDNTVGLGMHRYLLVPNGSEVDVKLSNGKTSYGKLDSEYTRLSGTFIIEEDTVIDAYSNFTSGSGLTVWKFSLNDELTGSNLHGTTSGSVFTYTLSGYHADNAAMIYNNSSGVLTKLRSGDSVEVDGGFLYMASGYYEDSRFIDTTPLVTDEPQGELITGEYNGLPVLSIFNKVPAKNTGVLTDAGNKKSVIEMLLEDPFTLGYLDDATGGPFMDEDSLAVDITGSIVGRDASIDYLGNYRLPFSFNYDFFKSFAEANGFNIDEIPFEQIQSEFFKYIYTMLYSIEDRVTVEEADLLALYEMANTHKVSFNTDSIFDFLDIDEDRYRASLNAAGYTFSDLEGSEYLIENFYGLLPEERVSALEGLNETYPNLKASYIENDGLFEGPDFRGTYSEYGIDNRLEPIELVRINSFNMSLEPVYIDPYDYVDTSEDSTEILFKEVTGIDNSRLNYNWIVLNVNPEEGTSIIANSENSAVSISLEDLSNDCKIILVISDKDGVPYFGRLRDFLDINKTSAYLWWNSVASNIIVDDTDPNYIKYDLTNSNAEALLIRYYDKIERSYIEFSVELLGLKEFYVPKLVPDRNARVIPVSSLTNPESEPADEPSGGLLLGDEVISYTEFETYESQFDGKTKQAYKLNAIKDGEFLQSVLLEYDEFFYQDPESGEDLREVRLVSVKPKYGSVFRKNVKVLILNPTVAEGINFAKFMSGAKITLPEGVEELDPSKISEAYIYLPINELSKYTGGKI